MKFVCFTNMTGNVQTKAKCKWHYQHKIFRIKVKKWKKFALYTSCNAPERLNCGMWSSVLYIYRVVKVHILDLQDCQSRTQGWGLWKYVEIISFYSKQWKGDEWILYWIGRFSDRTELRFKRRMLREGAQWLV